MPKTTVEDVKYALYTEQKTIEDVVADLMNSGHSEKEIEELFSQVAQQSKTELFKKRKQEEANKEKGNIAAIVIFMVALIGPVFKLNSEAWIVASALICGAAGYFGFPQKPLAAMVGAIAMAIIFPITYNMYFSNRDSFIRIEIVIPMLMAAVPSLIIYFVFGLMYQKKS